jgi:hypothetical protein
VDCVTYRPEKSVRAEIDNRNRAGAAVQFSSRILGAGSGRYPDLPPVKRLSVASAVVEPQLPMYASVARVQFLRLFSYVKKYDRELERGSQPRVQIF